jgi:Uma2 family endonuclease
LVIALTQFLESLTEDSQLELVNDVDVLLPGQENYLRPDNVIVRGDEVPDSGEMPLRLVPRLIVEVLSPSTGGRDIGIKRDIYAAGGVPEYWIVDPIDGSLSIFVDPQSAEYKQQPADEDGFIPSPFVGKAVRIQRIGRKYRVLTR